MKIEVFVIRYSSSGLLVSISYYISRHGDSRLKPRVKGAHSSFPPRILLAVGRFQDALEANLRAYSVRPNERAVISQMALNYYYLHDLSEAGKYFKKVLELDPLSAVSPQLYLAHIALAEKNQAEAVEYIKGFLEIHPNAPEAPHLRETLAALTSQTFLQPGQVLQTKH
jgi:cytochrome c-type biogenesis protein CcmH/NrfG